MPPHTPHPPHPTPPHPTHTPTTFLNDSESSHAPVLAPHIIGELALEFNGRHCQAMLTDELAWDCDDSELADYLNALFPIDTDSPTVGGLVMHTLYQAAERLGAEVTMHASTEDIFVGAPW